MRIPQLTFFILIIGLSFANAQTDSVLILQNRLDSADNKESVSIKIKIAEIYLKQNNPQKSIEYTAKAINEIKDFKTKSEPDESKLIFIIVLSGLLATIISIIVLFVLRKKDKKLINFQKEEITVQSNIIDQKSTEILDSIKYARKIQESILVPEDEIRKYLPEAFVFYRPKDIVSGDFYWISKVSDEIVLAAIDCSGHGVPGAFMSLIGNSLLNQIVNTNSITKPDIILKHLHLGMLSVLQQTGNNRAADDGMDMSLCTINPRLKRFQFAGAKNNLYVLQSNKLKVLRAAHHSVGGRPIREGVKVEFESYDFMYDENTIIYMLSDGYMDQFGGLKDTKFNAKRFKQMLIDNRALPMPEQKKVISETFDNWKGSNAQVDDILVMGVKLK